MAQYSSSVKTCLTPGPFQNRETWEKVVIVCMILALGLEALAVAWCVFTFFACCCRRNMLHPFTGFALTAAISLVIALAVYFSKFKDQIGDSESSLSKNNNKNITTPLLQLIPHSNIQDSVDIEWSLILIFNYFFYFKNIKFDC